MLINNRDISDHCLIWLIVNHSDWGSKPFMVNDVWFEDKSFLPFVESEWNNLKVSGRSDYVLKKKFCLLKFSLRRWNKNIFGRFDLEIKEGIKNINEADLLLSSCRDNLVQEVVAKRSVETSRMWKYMKIKENMLK